ncbi:MAG: Kae1-associated kinase Bud32 [Desulfurococcaceae archaeon]
MAGLKTTLLARGAEAEVYTADILGLSVIVKKRVSKPYRSSQFDKAFIQSRTRIEARILSELRSSGLRVPAVLLVDDENGVIVMEYIKGERLSNVFDVMEKEQAVQVAKEAGLFAARMHSMNIYHGDFTLANILLSGENRDLFVIDFGLSGYSTDIEEFAIDLHLLIRSAYVINPNTASFFADQLLEEYARNYRVGGSNVIKRVMEIRARGRYVDRELRKTAMRERYIG